jgi:transcription termination factor Rho
VIARTLRAAGRVVEIRDRPLLVGIVNATPDSFSDAGELPTLEARVRRAAEHVRAGAEVLDVGGRSAVGGRPPLPVAEELARVLPVVERVAGLGALVSVDTHSLLVAEAAVAAGAAIVNDVSGLHDPALADLCAATGAALVIMHTRVAPGGTLLDPAAYDDVVGDVRDFLAERMALALARGLDPQQIVLDPGPDFAKTPAQTVAVLRRLDVLHALGRPLLLAVSRKDFLGAITGRGPDARAAATLAALAAAADAGAQLLRVHDVAAAADLLAVRAVLRGERVLGPSEGLTTDRYPEGSLVSSALDRRPLRTTRPDAHRPTPRSAMSSVLDRSALEESPLADLHLLANELGVDGFRRLRRPELITAIVAKAGEGAEEAPADVAPADDAPADVVPGPADVVPAPADDVPAPADEEPDEEPEEGVTDEDARDRRPRRSRRGGRGRSRPRGDSDLDAEAEPAAPAAEAEDRTVEGTIELIGNGSAFLRLTPPEPSDDDVYVSAAQVKRCELVSGDRVTGPLRPPRRSERFPSLVRVDTINGRPADEVAEGTRFEDLPAAFPDERLELGTDDPTVKAIEWLTPFGKGSRVVITGAPRAGKSEALRRIAAALADHEGLDVSVVLCGVRPEEIREWDSPVAALGLAAPPDAQAQAVEWAVEQASRVAGRGGDAVVIIDTLDGLAPAAARKALAAARNIVDGGSLTVIATAVLPLGGETTVVTLDPTLTALRRFPALDLAQSGCLHPELLVGEAGAEAIARARVDAQT